MNSVADKIISDLEKLGCKARIAAISHVSEMRDELFGLKDHHLLDNKFYEDTLSWMSFDPDKELNNAKAIIAVAAPQMLTKAKFQYKGSTYSLSIPPTYIADDVHKQVKELIEETVGQYGFAVKRAPIPLKQLAVKSGLAKYGRNNITYIDGMGSFHVLMGYYTDMGLLTDSWQAAETDSACTNCSVCIKSCPTGASSTDRFLLHAEKCLTYLNEYENDFPEWVKPEWHNSLIGCMSCQLKCPKNAAFVNKSIELAAFTEEETKMLLDMVPLESLPEATVNKLNNISMIPNYSFLSRNLKVLLTDAFML